ncbi:type I restriction endonuclease [Dechloromonas denitrificans]|uniref:type I restriction endonuclease n=1 Tax=Dechloromonas denitrificans TaxID=281362 RepID=UPI000A403BEF|nr:type I restriction endonuclease [Dechloromonas denitrificans]
MTTTESQIEQDFIAKLKSLKYAYRPEIRDRASLEANFRKHFQELNRVSLSDSEFERLKDDLVTADVFAAAKRLREINSFERDDGTPLFYTLVNIKDWCKNTYEVVNQLRINTDNSHHRYDVVLLINGVPVVQVELKTLGVNPRRAMQQVVEYKNDPGNGYTRTLMCFMQLFIVSNQRETWYFANNNTRHFSFDADERFLPIYQFADESNEKINHLAPFAEKFLAKCTLGEMISRYMVLVASEQKLMIMRPYQIYAVRAIVDCIHQNRGNGYIWHTTGSGKTLTSFKTSTLLKDNPDIEKCLFVVDRKDLDRQTREEFNKFQANCVEENTNTETLVRRLLSTDYADKVIVTTIQKLGIALDGKDGEGHTLRATTDTPFFHHVAMLSELHAASLNGALYTHHFNTLRSILEKTANFFGHDDFSECLGTSGDEGLHARALNLLSHGKYSLYEPREMLEDNKALFTEILNGFLARYAFALPELAPAVAQAQPAVAEVVQ